MTLRLRPQRTAASSAKMIDRMSRLRYGQVQRSPRRKFFIRSRPVLGNGPGSRPAKEANRGNVPHPGRNRQGGLPGGLLSLDFEPYRHRKMVAVTAGERVVLFVAEPPRPA